MIYQQPTMYVTSILLPPILTQACKLGPSRDWRMKRLQKFFDSHDGQLGLNLKAIVHDLKLAISGKHAGRLFKQEMGIGVREYAKRNRLVTAAVLLRVCPDSIKEISARLGYRSVQDFTRAFRPVFNQTPTEFREAQRQAAQKVRQRRGSHDLNRSSISKRTDLGPPLSSLGDNAQKRLRNARTTRQEGL
jgi:AraC-like DNA-binding protein